MKASKITALVGLTTALIPLLWAENNDGIKQDLALLQGEWAMVSGSADGQAMPDDMLKQMKRVCKGDETTATMGGQVFLKAMITIDPSKQPKTIDYQMLDGFTKGKTQLGIYEVSGDTFKSCFAKAGGERPLDFTSKPGDGRTLSLWKREKPAGQDSQDAKSLNGDWVPVKAELAGQPVSDAVLNSITMKLADGAYDVSVSGEPDRGTYEVDASTTPRGLVIKGVAGPNKGRTIPAIYELEGRTLRICYDLSGGQRPKEFKSLPGTKLYRVTYQRKDGP
jgi:uncharacterized protein (TIGR03067 family)